MSRQYFQIDHAPEAQLVEAARIKRLLWGDQCDTDWDVKEVKDYGQLKRENNQMRRWLRHGETTLDMCHTHIITEINAKLPDLFKTKRRGSK